MFSLTKKMMPTNRQNSSAIGNAYHMVTILSFESRNATGSSTTSCLNTDIVML